MHMGFHEETDHCPEKGCKGSFEYIRQRSCSCHISPPCSACVDAPLTCNECGFEPDEPPYKVVPVVRGSPGISMRRWRARPLDSSKIDYRIKTDTHFTQRCEGVYPEGTTQEEVRAVVNGTFGGRFEQFGGGRFSFVAYTD